MERSSIAQLRLSHQSRSQLHPSQRPLSLPPRRRMLLQLPVLATLAFKVNTDLAADSIHLLIYLQNLQKRALLPALLVRTLTSALHASSTISMATTRSTASLLQSKIPPLSLLLKPCSLLAEILATTLSAMGATSTFTVFVTSVSTAQTGTFAQVALSTPVSSIPAIDLSPSTNPSTTVPPFLDHTAARLVTTASTATVLFAIKVMVLRHISRVTDTSALFATIPTSVPAARLALQTHTTELIL